MPAVHTIKANKETGTTVTLWDNRSGDWTSNDGEENWLNLCETHGTILSHTTRTVAKSFLSHPKEYCECCRGNCTEGLYGFVCNNCGAQDAAEAAEFGREVTA
jgi:hypothetical protein